MFREMRRIKQLLSPAETEAILARGSHGVLSVLGDDGYPYGVPISYAYADGRIYMHCAASGHKLDAIRSCDKAGFCVVDADDILPEKFTTCYRSAIAFGRVQLVTDEAEKRRAIELICAKYCPEIPAADTQTAIADEWAGLNILSFTVEHLTGKEANELVKRRKAD